MKKINGGVKIRSGGVSQNPKINKRPPPVYSGYKSNWITRVQVKTIYALLIF